MVNPTPNFKNLSDNDKDFKSDESQSASHSPVSMDISSSESRKGKPTFDNLFKLNVNQVKKEQPARKLKQSSVSLNCVDKIEELKLKAPEKLAEKV